MGSITSTMILAILPEILLLVLAMLVLILDLVVKPEWRRNLAWVTASGILIIMGVSVAIARPPMQADYLWGGMVRWDWAGFVFGQLVMFGAAMTALFGMDVDGLGDRGEFYILLLASTIGMTFLASSADLIMVYLSLETVAIPLYVLAGFLLLSDRSVEAGFKYLVFGAMSSAFMLYGFTLLYGFTGTTNLYEIVSSEYMQSIASDTVSKWPLIGILVLILVGFSFKVSAVPMHFWAPDVYEGAPTPIAGFLSTASKAVGFLILMRVFLIAFPVISQQWGALLAAISVATMTLGNMLALAQKNIKRMLAYSSIAHAGYALIGVATLTGLGLIATVYYLIGYLASNLAAFGAVSAYSKIVGSDEIKDFSGMSRRSPGLALIMLVAFLSLSGMPPFAGFIGKFLVFAAAVQAQLIWLAVVGVLNSIIGLYYYLVVLKVVYLYRSDEDEKPARMSAPVMFSLVILVVGIIVIGTFISPWFNWSYLAAAGLF